MHQPLSKWLQRWLARNRSAIVLFGLNLLSKESRRCFAENGWRWLAPGGGGQGVLKGEKRAMGIAENGWRWLAAGGGRQGVLKGEERAMGIAGSGWRWLAAGGGGQGFRGFGSSKTHQVRRKIRQHQGFRRFRTISLYTWMGAHLLLIIIINSISVYKAYHEFYHTPQTSGIVQQLTPLAEARAIRYYGRYTGAETGYGFFGINVRSNGMLIGECGGKAMTADFKSYETTLRFFSMANALTDDFIKPDAHDSLPGGLLGEYNNLVFKNIAVTMYQQHGCVDSTVLLSYNVLQFPTLHAIRTGTPPEYQLTKLVTGTYSLTPHAQ